MTHATVPALSGRSLSPAYFALVSYLARYQGNTHQTYSYHLRNWFEWCEAQGLDPLTDIVRAHVEMYVRHRMIDLGNSAATANTFMSPIKGYFRFAAIDGLIDRNPAEYAHVPVAQHDDSNKLGLDRLELGKFLAVAKSVGPRHHGLAYVLGVLGLRISEACSIDIEHYQETERGYRVLRMVGKGNKRATIPLTVPVIRAMDDAKGDRTAGRLLTTRDGRPLTRHSATSLVDTICRHAGFDKHVHPHMLRASAITNALDAGVPLRDVQYLARHADPRTTMGYDRARGNHDRHAVHVLSAYVAGAA